MINVIDDEKTIMVEFLDESNARISGELLTYEMCGEACVRIDADRIWIPFKKLTRESRARVLNSGVNIKNYAKKIHLQEPKIGFIITFLVLILYFYCYLQYGS